MATTLGKELLRDVDFKAFIKVAFNHYNNYWGNYSIENGIITPDNYYLEQIEETTKEIEKNITKSDMDWQEELERIFQDEQQRYIEMQNEKEENTIRYKRFLEKLDMWANNSKYNEDFIIFLREDIKKSMEQDFSFVIEPPKKKSVIQFKLAQLSVLQLRLESYINRYTDQINDVERRNILVKQMLESLDR